MTKFDWEDCAKKLWGLLDDIDTYGDMFKPEITPYFKAVNNKASERHKLLRSNGYDLFIPGTMEERESKTELMTHNASPQEKEQS